MMNKKTMMKINDCFVGQHQADIDNLKNFINNHPLVVIGFNAMASLIVQHLEITLDVRLYINYERHNYYWYLKVDKYCPNDVSVIQKVIYDYIHLNCWDSFIKINQTINNSILVLKSDID